MEAPSMRDYYGDLGIPQTATQQEIRRAHRILAKKHHPDKQAPGAYADAHEFRQVQEAYEHLRDESKRKRYDIFYEELRQHWAAYHAWQRDERDREKKARVEEEERRRRAEKVEQARRYEEYIKAARERAEQEDKAARGRETHRKAEAERIAREKEEKKQLRRRKEKIAEERSREAARRAREQLERAARERLRQQKEAEAERRSQEALKKAIAEREKAAKERLRMLMVEEKQANIRESWARMREAADKQKDRKHTKQEDIPVPDTSCCDHPQFGWPKKKGKAVCGFCEETRTQFSFHCPLCNYGGLPGL